MINVGFLCLEKLKGYIADWQIGYPPTHPLVIPIPCKSVSLSLSLCLYVSVYMSKSVYTYLLCSKPKTLNLLGGSGDLVTRLITPISHIINNPKYPHY